MAALSKFDSSRIGLLNNLTDLLWTYGVNQTTYLPYYAINSDGSVANYNAVTQNPPDALSVVDAFIFAYKETGNATYLDHAESVLNAIYTYMRHPTYDTIITSVDARNGTITNNASRAGDQLANFIETTLFLYEVSGDETYLNWSIYQADQYTKYAWDDTNKVYYYRPDVPQYEAYVPSFSLALLHLYGYTDNQTYLDNAKSNFSGYMNELKRNGLLIHWFRSDGKYGNEPAFFMYDIPVVAALLHRYTGDETYIDVSDKYTAMLLDYFYPIDAGSIRSDSFALYYPLPYLRRQEFTTDLLYRFILPSSGVNISWAYRGDLHGKYNGLTSAPMNVSFERDAVHLYDVSGDGTIEFYPNIKNVYIAPQLNSRIRLAMLNDLSIIPPFGAVDVEVGDNLISINYGDSSLAGMAISNINRGVDFNSNGTTSMRIEQAGTMDVSVSTWLNTDTCHKRWTESSTSAGLTNTVHTVGDLEVNKYYNVKVDDILGQNISGDNCASGVCKANAQGKITFTYTGTYSNHTFDVEEGDNTAPVLSDLTPQGITYSAGTNSATLSLITNENSICKYSTVTNQNYSDMPDTFQTTGGQTHSTTISNLQNGNTYQYFVKCQDTAGNVSEGDQELSFSVSSSDFIPTLAIGNSKIYRLSPDISLAVRSKYVVFRGKINSLTNGRVELYQDGTLKKSDKINKYSKWRIRINERRKSATHTYQFKYYDQNNQNVETSQTFTVIIDREKPKFTYLPKRITKNPGDTITWQVSDNDQIKSYQYTFRGRKISTSEDFFTLPASLPKGQSNLAVRAYDRAGNKAVRRARIIVR